MPEPPRVTQITSHATHDDLTDAQYREIYDELRTKCTLRAFKDFVGSAVSHTWWDNYEHDRARLTRDRRNELRAAVGLPELPPTVLDAVAARSEPDATVYQVGDAPADRLVLCGADVASVTMRLNGDLRVAPGSHVMGLTRPRLRRARGSIEIGHDLHQRLNARRRAAGLSWDTFLAPLDADADENPPAGC